MEEADDRIVDQLIALGIISVMDLEDVGTEPLENELQLTHETAQQLIDMAAKEVEKIAEATKQKQAEKELAQQTEYKKPDSLA
jgi:hypothetical protein